MTTVSEPIVFLEGAQPSSHSLHLQALRSAMPEEVILPLSALDQRQCRDAKVAILATARLDALSRLPNLLWLHTLWAGVDHLVAQLADRPLPVVRLVDDEQSRRMGEAVLAWSLYLQRNMPAYAAQQSQKLWRQIAYREPASMRVGLLGMGAMGAAAAARLSDAGFAVASWTRSSKRPAMGDAYTGADGLAALLGTSDIVVCLLPLTAETHGLLDAARLALMKPGAALINFGRGEILAEAALLEALDRGHLRHAVLDVFVTEPLPEVSRLWDHPAVTVLPHIAARTDPASTARTVAATIRRYRETGTVPAGIDLSRGY